MNKIKPDEIPGDVRAPRNLVATGLIELGSSLVGIGWRAKLHNKSPLEISSHDRRDVKEALETIPNKYRRWVLRWLRYGAQERRKSLEGSAQ